MASSSPSMVQSGSIPSGKSKRKVPNDGSMTWSVVDTGNEFERMARICSRRFDSMLENHFTITFKCSVETIVSIGRACIQQVHDGAKIARCLDDEGSNGNFSLVVVVRNRPHYEQRETVGPSATVMSMHPQFQETSLRLKYDEYSYVKHHFAPLIRSSAHHRSIISASPRRAGRGSS